MRLLPEAIELQVGLSHNGKRHGVSGAGYIKPWTGE